MPRKPKRPCRYPGCAKLADGVYCEAHEKLMNSHYNHFARGYNSHQRYGRAWEKIRNRYIAAHPLVHHKKPISDGGTNEESNLMSLCNSCHEKIHGGRGGENP